MSEGLVAERFGSCLKGKMNLAAEQPAMVNEAQ